MPSPFFRKLGREPKIPQVWPDGGVEFDSRGRKFRIDTQNNKASLWSQELDGTWVYRGEAENRPRLVDLVTSTTGQYRWSRGETLPQPVQSFLYPKQESE